MAAAPAPTERRMDHKTTQKRVDWICLMIEIIRALFALRQDDGNIVIPADHWLNDAIVQMNQYFRTGKQPELEEAK